MYDKFESAKNHQAMRWTTRTWRRWGTWQIITKVMAITKIIRICMTTTAASSSKQFISFPMWFAQTSTCFFACLSAWWIVRRTRRNPRQLEFGNIGVFQSMQAKSSLCFEALLSYYCHIIVITLNLRANVILIKLLYLSSGCVSIALNIKLGHEILN